MRIKSQENADLDIVGAVSAAVTRDAKPTVVENASLGYREGMRHEITPAPAWRMPIADFVRYMGAARRSPKTIALRSYHLRVVSQSFRHRSPYGLIDADLEGFLAALGRHTAANTTRSYQMTLRMFYRYAMRHGLVQSDPMQYIETVSAKIGKPRPADVAAVQAALANAEPAVRLMIQLGVTAGLRRAEIAAVHTRDLVHNHNGYSLRIPAGKGDKTRVVPISHLLAARILEAPEGWLFPSQKGIDAHLQPGAIGDHMGAVLRPLNLTPHMLRHRFATTAYAARGNLIAVQELLGHASIATTAVYTQTPDDEMRTAANAAADLFT